VNASNPTPASTGQPAPRKGMSTKEVPAFAWKLVGYVDGLTVTLLKSVDRSEVEAQYERLRDEDYYRGVTIYPIDAEVPPDPLAAKFARSERKAAKLKSTPKRTRKTARAKKGKPATVVKAKVKKTPPKPAAKARAPRTAARKKTTAKKKATPERKAAAKKKTTRAPQPAAKAKAAKKTQSLPSKRTRGGGSYE